MPISRSANPRILGPLPWGPVTNTAVDPRTLVPLHPPRPLGQVGRRRKIGQPRVANGVIGAASDGPCALGLLFPVTTPGLVCSNDFKSASKAPLLPPAAAELAHRSYVGALRYCRPLQPLLEPWPTSNMRSTVSPLTSCGSIIP
jgi:hypothetical protein